MRISTKGRYALAAMICMAQTHPTGEYVTAVSIADRLGISKIYLEQVFSLLKRGSLVQSVKGAQGGYRLARNPSDISALEILTASETALFETSEEAVITQSPAIEKTIRTEILDPMNRVLQSTLSRISLSQLMMEMINHQSEDIMYFI